MDSIEYYYRFKDNAKRKLLNDFENVEDKIAYIDILEMKEDYNNFIRKLIHLLMYSEDFTRVEKLEINDLLMSLKVIDRLNGLKRCKSFIKIEGVINEIN